MTLLLQLPHTVSVFAILMSLVAMESELYWQKDDLVLEENMIISVDMPVLHTGIGGSAHLEDLTPDHQRWL